MRTSFGAWAGASRVLVAASALLLFGGRPPRAEAARIVVLVADRLERADLWEWRGPHLSRLRQEAAAGLMCTRFLLSSLPESAYVALGAGTYVQYEGSRRWRGGQPDDGEAFARGTGRRLPQGALYCWESERLRLYSNLDARPGALGTALHAAGRRTACIGNADLPGLPRRQILSLLMDALGVVDGGDVSARTSPAFPSAPGGARCDPAAIAGVFEKAAARADVVAIEFGDTSRLAAARDDMTPAAYARAREAALARLDTLVGLLRARILPERTLFLLVSPAPPVAPSATDQVLTPVFAVGRGWGPGLLTSATTRRPGLIATADVTATIAAAAGAGPLPEGTGRPIVVVPCANVAAHVRAMDESARRVARWRFRVFPFWAALIGPALASGPLLIVWRSVRRASLPFWLTAGARYLQLAALSLPEAALAAASPLPASLWLYLVFLGMGAAVLAAGAMLLERRWPQVPAPAWLGAATAAALLADAALGAPRQPQLMVSYALTEGARYYGLGNEMMGVIIGLGLAMLMSLPLCGGRARTAMAAAVGALLSAGIGHPGIGANFGGALTAAAAFGTAAVVLGGARGARAVCAPLAAMALTGAALVALDWLGGPEGMSHIGRAVVGLRSEGMAWAAELMERKADMNRILIGRSGITGLFFVALPVLLAVALRPPAGIQFSHSGVRPLLVCGVVGGVAALLLNDSGIIAGGLLLAFVAIGAGYLSLAGEEAPACESLR